jgi:hypothetical protein
MQNVATDVPEGQRFSHVYLDRGEPTDVTDRVRVRLRSLVVSIRDLRTSTVVEDKLGINFSNWQHFFDTAKNHDVLDLVTVAYQFLASHSPDVACTPSGGCGPFGKYF